MKDVGIIQTETVEVPSEKKVEEGHAEEKKEEVQKQEEAKIEQERSASS